MGLCVKHKKNKTRWCCSGYQSIDPESITRAELGDVTHTDAPFCLSSNYESPWWQR